MDEKGFLIGVGSATKRVMSREALRNGRITHASQDGSREFISLLACISGDGTALPPSLIYSGQTGDLRDSWVEDLVASDEAYFSATEKGWTCNKLGVEWLQNVFDRHTKLKAGNRRRLLIVDGHSSHVNMEFLDVADRLNIIIHVLPAHSTHRLQPLDVSLFAPLVTHYSNGLTKLMADSLGHVTMTKRLFWTIFRDAFAAAFNFSNITSSWAKTGLFPFNPEVVLSKIRRPASPTPVDTIQTPHSSRGVRRLQKSYQQSPSNQKLDKIFKSNQDLAATSEIRTHAFRRLEEAFGLERAKRSRGKRLNLVGEQDSGPQWFSPARIQRARDAQGAKEAEKEAQESARLDKKAETVARKSEQEEAKVQRVAERERKRVERKQEEEARKEARSKAKELREAAAANRKRSTALTGPRKRRIEEVVDLVDVGGEEEEEEPVRTNSRGRAIQRPKRFA